MTDTQKNPPETPKSDERKLDDAVKETFPASDAPANSGTTGPND